jgi:hypothetical protein
MMNTWPLFSIRYALESDLTGLFKAPISIIFGKVEEEISIG